jgi:NAD(P)-dependent dehydrogenase (short-subunit alcohol dehydrogenase family)
MADRLKQKVAIVAGAGSVAPGWSNGKATAVLFAREGAKVFVVDRDLDLAEETQSIIDAEGGECTVHVCDVSLPDQVDAMVAACKTAYGRIDVLFNNVGLQAVGGPLDITDEDWDRLMTVNVKSMFYTCRAVLPTMLEQDSGSIVNNASLAAIRFAYPSVAYAASKGAVVQLSQNIACQYAAKGIRCNSVLPGFMATPRITKRLRDTYGEEGYEEQLRARDRMVPMGKMGDGWDVAYGVLYLASDEAKHVTGIELIIDGGLAASVIGRPWEGE